MNKLIVIRGSYKPNTAPVNRLLSMLRGFDELGVDVEMVFVYPNENGDVLEESQYRHIHVVNLWKSHKYHNKWLRYLRSFWDARKYARSLNPGSKVFVAGSSEYVPFFVGRRGVDVYQERTEHHTVVSLQPSFLQDKYLRCIPRLKGMFVISTALREEYMNCVDAHNVIIVNMTVDANRFSNLKKEQTADDYVAYCGTASNTKDGVDDLIKSFAIVHERYPDLKLYVIGKAPKKTDESGNLELVHNLGLDDVVIFTGVVPAEQMPQLLKNARCLALARPDSLQARCGFPTKLGEYLLTGNPVVVTKVGDISLFLEHGKSAMLAEQHDPDDFAKQLLWVLDHPQEAALIGVEGMKVAMQNFNYKTETEKIVRTILPEQSL